MSPFRKTEMTWKRLKTVQWNHIPKKLKFIIPKLTPSLSSFHKFNSETHTKLFHYISNLHFHRPTHLTKSNGPQFSLQGIRPTRRNDCRRVRDRRLKHRLQSHFRPPNQLLCLHLLHLSRCRSRPSSFRLNLPQVLPITQSDPFLVIYRILPSLFFGFFRSGVFPSEKLSFLLRLISLSAMGYEIVIDWGIRVLKYWFVWLKLIKELFVIEELDVNYFRIKDWSIVRQRLLPP